MADFGMTALVDRALHENPYSKMAKTLTFQGYA